MENVFENIKNVSENAAEKVENAVENVEKAVENAENAVENVVERNEGVLFCAPVGRLDTVSSAALKEQIDAIGTEDADIELDFANVAYISSAGLRLLVALQKQAKAGGHTMVIKNTNAVVNEVFRVSGFNKTFTVL
ncbi:MAG: anti-sigma factor antagonist [Lachnospiraceae bacterium]|nr:anti-sigma factor antagonist [Lachnospiraceae bacterium]